MTLGSHQRAVGKSQTYFTPKALIDALGPFDLDPCAGDPRPWDCAATNWIEADDGLSRAWFGLVWCNPPFDSRFAGLWTRKMADHGNGILLVHARTETEWFRPIWERATALLFLDSRVDFYDETGQSYGYNSGAPVVLAGFGETAVERLARFGRGFLVTRWRMPVPEDLLGAL